MVLIDPQASIALLDRHPGLGTIAKAFSVVIGSLSLIVTITSIYIPPGGKVRKARKKNRPGHVRRRASVIGKRSRARLGADFWSVPVEWQAGVRRIEVAEMRAHERNRERDASARRWSLVVSRTSRQGQRAAPFFRADGNGSRNGMPPLLRSGGPQARPSRTGVVGLQS